MNLADGLSRMLARLYAASATPLTFRHPKTQRMVSLPAIDRSSLLMDDLQALKFGSLKLLCTVRRSDLAALGLVQSDMVDVDVTFAGKTRRVLTTHEKPDASWRVTNNQFKPVPSWEANGEAILELMDVT